MSNMVLLSSSGHFGIARGKAFCEHLIIQQSIPLKYTEIEVSLLNPQTPVGRQLETPA